ncbi:MAG: hypothetical protein IAE82_13760 [Opitutaceae bacterium]|nr:hypothetical protein [Opitutaceae bacterium]
MNHPAVRSKVSRAPQQPENGERFDPTTKPASGLSELLDENGVPRSALFGCSGALFVLAGIGGVAVYCGLRFLA